MATSFLASFARNSIAYDQNGKKIAKNVPRYQTGKFHKAALIERSTTNLLTANQSDVETDLTGLAVSGGTLARVTDAYWTGNASACATSNASANLQINTSALRASISPSTAHTFSVSAKAQAAAGRQWRLEIWWYDSSEALIGGNSGTASAFSSTWTRLSFTATSPSNAASCYVELVLESAVSGEKLWWDGAQLEQYGDDHTFITGGATRVGETLAVPTKDIFTKSNWAVEFIFTPACSQQVVNNILWLCYIDSYNYYALYTNSSGQLQGAVRHNENLYVTSLVASVLQIGTPYLITFSGNGSVLRLCANGAQLGSDVSYTEPDGILPDNMYFGSYYDGNYPADGLLEDIRVGMARSVSEHQADYSRNKPLVFDAKTKVLIPLNGTVTAYTKRLTVIIDSTNAWVLQPLGGTLLTDSNLLILPDWKRYAEEVDNFAGDIDFGGVNKNRNIDLSMLVQKANADKFAYLRNVAKWLDPSDGWQEFLFEDDGDKCLLALCDKPVSYANLFNQLKFKLSLICQPYYQSTGKKWLWGSGTANNAGNVATPCVITFYDACTNPSVTINGVAVSYTGSLVDGDVLVIDTGKMTAKKNGVNVLGSMNGNFPKLNPGDNTVTTSFFCSIVWRDRWI